MTKEELETKKESLYLRNFIAFCIEGFTFSGAMSIFSPDSILPAYISNLTSSPFALSLLIAVEYGLAYGSYIFACSIGLRAKSPKWTSVSICFLQRIGYFFIFLSTYSTADPSKALVLFFVAYAFYALSGGLSNPLYQQMVSVSIFKNVSSFFGVYEIFGAAGGLVGSILFQTLVKRFEFPLSYRYTFLFGLILSLIATAVVAIGVKEVIDDRKTEKISTKQVLGIGKDILKTNKDYRNFVLIRIIMAVGELSVPYYIGTIISKPGAPANYEGTLAIVYLVAKMLGTYIEGKLGDKYSFYAIMKICCISGIIASAIAIVSNNWIICTVMYCFVAFAQGGSWIVNSVANIEFSRGSNYITIYSAMLGLSLAPIYIVSSLCGAAIANALSIKAMFVITLVAYLSALIMISRKGRVNE